MLDTFGSIGMGRAWHYVMIDPPYSQYSVIYIDTEMCVWLGYIIKSFDHCCRRNFAHCLVASSHDTLGWTILVIFHAMKYVLLSFISFIWFSNLQIGDNVYILRTVSGRGGEPMGKKWGHFPILGPFSP